MPISAPKKDRELSGKMLYPAPPKTIGASERPLQTFTISLTGFNNNLGLSILWSSMFLTDIPIMSAWNPSIASFRTVGVSFSISKSTIAASCPALLVEEATQARPRGKTGMLIFSVLAEIKRARMI
jgi:hypothetical protein